MKIEIITGLGTTSVNPRTEAINLTLQYYDGVTVTEGIGAWKNDGKTEMEPVFIITVLATSNSAQAYILAERIRRHFGQVAVTLTMDNIHGLLYAGYDYRAF